MKNILDVDNFWYGRTHFKSFMSEWVHKVVNWKKLVMWTFRYNQKLFRYFNIVVVKKNVVLTMVADNVI